MNEKKKILIIEDDDDTRSVLESILDSMGYSVSQAENGTKGIDTAGQVVPDLILLDIMLPKMSGFDVCKELKSNPKTKNIPVIFLTALDRTSDRVQGISLSANAYITKPFRKSELEKVINEVLSGKKRPDNS